MSSYFEFSLLELNWDHKREEEREESNPIGPVLIFIYLFVFLSYQ